MASVVCFASDEPEVSATCLQGNGAEVALARHPTSEMLDTLQSSFPIGLIGSLDLGTGESVLSLELERLKRFFS